jgi:hypothetical protein
MAGMSVGCGLSTQRVAILALEAELGAIGGQEQLDGGGGVAEAVVERLHAVGLVDAFQGHHGHQDLLVGDLAGLRVNSGCRW